jgi:hypothetical protein
LVTAPLVACAERDVKVEIGLRPGRGQAPRGVKGPGMERERGQPVRVRSQREGRGLSHVTGSIRVVRVGARREPARVGGRGRSRGASGFVRVGGWAQGLSRGGDMIGSQVAARRAGEPVDGPVGTEWSRSLEREPLWVV